MGGMYYNSFDLGSVETVFSSTHPPTNPKPSPQKQFHKRACVYGNNCVCVRSKSMVLLPIALMDGYG